MKEEEHVAENRDRTRDIQVFSLTLFQLSYFGLFVINFHAEICLFTENKNLNKKVVTEFPNLLMLESYIQNNAYIKFFVRNWKLLGK